jgi:hypothetical protein
MAEKIPLRYERAAAQLETVRGEKRTAMEDLKIRDREIGELKRRITLLKPKAGAGFADQDFDGNALNHNSLSRERKLSDGSVNPNINSGSMNNSSIRTNPAKAAGSSMKGSGKGGSVAAKTPSKAGGRLLQPKKNNNAANINNANNHNAGNSSINTGSGNPNNVNVSGMNRATAPTSRKPDAVAAAYDAYLQNQGYEIPQDDYLTDETPDPGAAYSNHTDYDADAVESNNAVHPADPHDMPTTYGTPFPNAVSGGNPNISNPNNHYPGPAKKSTGQIRSGPPGFHNVNGPGNANSGKPIKVNQSGYQVGGKLEQEMQEVERQNRNDISVNASVNTSQQHLDVNASLDTNVNATFAKVIQKNTMNRKESGQAGATVPPNRAGHTVLAKMPGAPGASGPVRTGPGNGYGPSGSKAAAKSALGKSKPKAKSGYGKAKSASSSASSSGVSLPLLEEQDPRRRGSASSSNGPTGGPGPKYPAPKSTAMHKAAGGPGGNLAKASAASASSAHNAQNASRLPQPPPQTQTQSNGNGRASQNNRRSNRFNYAGENSIVGNNDDDSDEYDDFGGMDNDFGGIPDDSFGNGDGMVDSDDEGGGDETVLVAMAAG